MKKIASILLAIILVLSADAAQKPKYIFLFIGDGMGFHHIALTEAAYSNANSGIGYEQLNFTKFPVVSFVTTHAANRQTTCSAAAGTALATGHKTSINTISMNVDRTEDLVSIAVKAKEKGFKVGLATSASIDHATPAAFYAHAPKRNMYYPIAQWITKAGFDLYASGGLLKPNEGPSIYDMITQDGYTIVRGSGQELFGTKVYWEQAAGYNSDALPMAIDSKKGDLTIGEITEKSIRFLENKKGFFLMVEGGQIDWAAHGNDAGSIVRETKDFANAIDQAIDFYNRHPNETLIIVTADHETGGLSLGRDDRGYDTDFGLLFAQKMSKGRLVEAVKATKNWEEAKNIFAQQVGLWDSVKPTSKEELELLIAYEIGADEAVSAALGILYQRAGVTFTTSAHTAAFVPLFAIGAGSQAFAGRHDNIDIPRKIISLIE